MIVVTVGCADQLDELPLGSANPTSSEIPNLHGETANPSSTPQSPAGEVSVSDQIAIEFGQLIDLRLDCGRQPARCPISELTARDSRYRNYLVNLMEMRAEANLATRADAGTFRFRIDRIEVIGSVSAIVHTCIFDSLVVFDLGQSDSTRDDIVFDDDVISGHTEWHMVIDEDAWKWSDATGSDATYGEDICGIIS
ncbi:MAG: hypothetical protein ABI570_05255 [Ilumatobacteraceae bacterium]